MSGDKRIKYFYVCEDCVFQSYDRKEAYGHHFKMGDKVARFIVDGVTGEVKRCGIAT